MKTQNRISAATLLVVSLFTTQNAASENIPQISELCRSSNDSGIKRIVNFILADESASDAAILCQQQLNTKSEEATLEATYSINKMRDSRFREARGYIENPIQSRFKSSSNESTRTYRNISKPEENIVLPTLKGFQTVPR